MRTARASGFTPGAWVPCSEEMLSRSDAISSSTGSEALEADWGGAVGIPASASARGVKAPQTHAGSGRDRAAVS
jgi:hypothetical protein